MPRDTEERCPWSVCRTLQAFTLAERWRGKKNDSARKTCWSESIPQVGGLKTTVACVKFSLVPFKVSCLSGGTNLHSKCGPQSLSQRMVLAEIDIFKRSSHSDV